MELEEQMSTMTRNDARLDVRLASAQKAEFERAAILQNRSLTEFAIAAMEEAARKAIAESERHAHVQLSNRDRDRFLAMLDRDPSPNRALERAARSYRKHVV
jgi:uncharacterized protein (DUF1778 family)